MKKLYCLSIFRAMICTLTVIVSLNYAHGQKLYMYVIWQNDNAIGSAVDKTTMEKLAEQIRAETNMQVIVKTKDGSQATKTWLENELRVILKKYDSIQFF